MVDTAGYLSKNCNQFLSLELERSSDLKQEIVSDFRTSIVTILVVSVVIIALAVILSIAITRRRSVSVRLAVYQNACRKMQTELWKMRRSRCWIRRQETATWNYIRSSLKRRLPDSN